MTLYGYYSKKQETDNGIVYKYEDMEGKIILVSEVSQYNRTGDELIEFYDDNINMGKIGKFISQVKSPDYKSKRLEKYI
jgi:hypothetical protein